MKRVNRRIFNILALVTFLTAWYAPPAAAASDFPLYTYLAEDLTLQEHPAPPDPDPPENFAHYYWMLIWGAQMTWSADALILDDAQAAIAAWESTTMIPNLNWGSNAVQDGYVKIHDGACPGDTTAVSCYKVGGKYYDPDRDANYLMNVDIYINPTYQWAPLTRKLAIEHELGRFYGLYERKLTGPDACNPDEFTIMDRFYVENNYVMACDYVDNPTALDKQRVDSFWSGGTPLRADLPINAWGNGSVATYRWHDLAWAETKTIDTFPVPG